MPADQTVQRDAGSDDPRLGQPTRPAAPVSEDLSAAVVATVKKRPGDIVRCTHVSGNRYRCNWWSAEPVKGYDNPGMAGLMVTTHRVRKSRFLRVTRTAGGITIGVDAASGATSLAEEAG